MQAHCFWKKTHTGIERSFSWTYLNTHWTSSCWSISCFTYSSSLCAEYGGLNTVFETGVESLYWEGFARHVLQNIPCVLAGRIGCAVLVVTELQLDYFAFGWIDNVGIMWVRRGPLRCCCHCLHESFFTFPRKRSQWFLSCLPKTFGFI